MTSDSFGTDPHDPTSDSPGEAVDSPDSPDAPLTATGERSTTVEDEDGGVLPVPEPTADGAPAP